jgi:putative solute:sodium symporter small subunit
MGQHIPERAASGPGEDLSNRQRAVISEESVKQYWSQNVATMVSLLVVWFLVSFGAGILFRPFLDQFSIGGAPLGFWFAQQGSIIVFVVLIFIYGVVMHNLEKKYDVEDDQG